MHPLGLFSGRERLRRIGRAAPAAALLAGLLAAAPACAQPAGPEPPSAKTGRIKFDIRRLTGDLNEGIAVGDVNNDGVVDLTAGEKWYQGPDFKPRPIRCLEVENEEFFTSNGEHLMDLNGDGWLDIITASWFSDRILWLENPGRDGLEAGVPWKQHLVVDGQHSCEGTLPADLDGDGRDELVVNSWDRQRPLTVVRITPGTGGAPPAFEKVIIGTPGFGHGLGVGDINGDGRPDILTGGGWFENPGEGCMEKPWRLHPGFDLRHLSLPCLIVDVNGDGRNDLIIGQAHDYLLRWFEQGPVKDGQITWTPHEIDRTWSQAHCLVWEDLDGDGRKELITGKRWRAHKDGDPGAAEPVGLFRYLWDPAAGRFERDTITYNQHVGSGMQIRIADLNGDGRPDIAVAGKSGTFVLTNRGPATPAP